MTVYSNSGAGSLHVDMFCNPGGFSQRSAQRGSYYLAAVNYVPNSYSRYVLKIDPATKETDRSISQRHNWSEIMAAWVWGRFSEEFLKALSLKSGQFQWNVPANNNGSVKCDDPTMIKLILDYIRPSTMVGTDRQRKIIQNCHLKKHGHNVIKAMEEIETSLQQIE